MDVFKLRPHHINCLFFYEGKGYSKQFVENMNCIVEHLRNNPEQMIVLEKQNDSLCGVCPNLKENLCISSDKIGSLDQATLENYGLKEDEIYSFQEIKEKIYKNFSSTTFHLICSRCEWYKSRVCTEEKIRGQKEIWK